MMLLIIGANTHAQTWPMLTGNSGCYPAIGIIIITIRLDTVAHLNEHLGAHGQRIDRNEFAYSSFVRIFFYNFALAMRKSGRDK